MGFNKFDKRSGGGGGGFGGGGRFGGGKPFGGKRFGGHSDGPRQMFPAVCSDCGQDCEIPFKPSGDRPVFCRNCFQKQDGQAPKFGNKSFDKPRSFGGDRPSFGAGNSSNGAGGVSKAQIEALNTKLDKIITLLGGKAEAPVKKEFFAKKADKVDNDDFYMAAEADDEMPEVKIMPEAKAELKAAKKAAKKADKKGKGKKK